MDILFKQAKYGDCIHIKHNGRNIIIDTGPSNSMAFNQLIEEIESLNERIDLLVITHYDSDHIGGLAKMDHSKWNLIDNIWFNSSNVTTPIGEENRQLSIREANLVASELLKSGVNWDRALTKGKEFTIGDNWKLIILYGGYDAAPESGGEFLTTPKCDWSSSFQELEPYCNDDAIDASSTNASSIVLLLTNGENNFLFPGDSTPERLLDALSDYSYDNPLVLDFFKMPHHGSYKNITQKVLERIVCSDYIILTNGEIQCHPNKKAILKVSKWGRSQENKFRFHLNYYSDLIKKLNILAEEKDKYKFELDGVSNVQK